MKAKVYFSRTITPEKVLELYQILGKQLPGKVAIKLHSGETGNQNFLKPDFWKPVIDHIGGT
ncbi:MAG: ferredoxin, partial [Lachnospiraceae bacterium]|nr:ferredoxin [Lachnospiraceae bacterium]